MKRQGLTQKDLAFRIGKGRQVVGHYMTGQVGKSFRVVELLAKALDLDPKDLII